MTASTISPEGLEELVPPGVCVDRSSTYLYRLYDEASRLLYVGITRHPHTRFVAHSSTKRWWASVHATSVEQHCTRWHARVAETLAIRNGSPVHNVHQAQGNHQPSTRRTKALFGQVRSSAEPEVTARQLLRDPRVAHTDRRVLLIAFVEGWLLDPTSDRCEH